MSFFRIAVGIYFALISMSIYAEEGKTEEQAEEHTEVTNQSATSSEIRSRRYVYSAFGVGLTAFETRAGVYLPYDTALEFVSQYMMFPDTRSVAIRGKKYFWNRFYGSAEFGGGKSEAGMASSYHYESKMHYEMFGIGNEWSPFEHVLIGFEWIAVGTVHWKDGEGKYSNIGSKESQALRVGTLSLGFSF